MGLAEESITRLSRDYPGLTVVARRSGSAGPGPLRKLLYRMFPALGDLAHQSLGPVLAVSVSVEGIRGGRSTARCRYELIIDTTDLRRAIPPIWVCAPPDREIRHVNIWRASKSFCRWSGTRLPSFCWHRFADGWSQAPPKSRTLGAALEYAKQLLNTENHDSPAR